MRKSIYTTALSSAFLLAAVALPATPNDAHAGLADVLSNNGEGYDLGTAVLGEDSAYDIGGWTQFGYTSRSTGLFNDQPDGVRNQQTWLYFEKAVDGSDGLDIGFRVDAVYGADAQDTQSFGNNDGEWDLRDNFNHGDDGFAIPQLYVEAAAGDLSVKAGHFYTLVGYEVVTAPDNFFMSHAFTMYLSEPFTHTGVVATYSGFENVEFYGGWTAGWDTGFDQSDGGSSFLGGFSLNPCESVALTYIATVGNLGAIGDGYSHSIVVDTAISDKLNYVVQSDLVTTNADVLGIGEDYESYGLNNYLTYQISDMWGVGTRAEWWNANDASYYEVTAGVNYKPAPNLTFRPELRYQWGDGNEDESQTVTADNPVGLPIDEGVIFGMDAIFTF
jgi:hypothetical protein